MVLVRLGELQAAIYLTYLELVNIRSSLIVKSKDGRTRDA